MNYLFGNCVVRYFVITFFKYLEIRKLKRVFRVRLKLLSAIFRYFVSIWLVQMFNVQLQLKILAFNQCLMALRILLKMSQTLRMRFCRYFSPGSVDGAEMLTVFWHHLLSLAGNTCDMKMNPNTSAEKYRV